VKRWIPLASSIAVLLGAGLAVSGHDVITTKITWNREIIRILSAHCLTCHRPEGSAFSLATYNDGRPWAKAIQEEVLERRMPPWGAVKGFGDFRNDKALTAEQLEVIAEWVDGGAPEGEDKDLPPPPKFAEEPAPGAQPQGSIRASGDFALTADFVLDTLIPEKVPENVSFQMIAELPDGTVQPLLWLFPFKPSYAHPFELRAPLRLEKGTRIRGIPQGATIVFAPAPEAPPSTTAQN
jgi:hypothetical protein